MTMPGRTHRLRAVTRAMLWFPLAGVLAAAAFAAWLWVGCASRRSVAPCRSEIIGEALWAFAIVLAGGLILLAALWLITFPFARRRREAGRSAGDDAVFDGEVRSWPPASSDPNSADVLPTRAARHARSAEPGRG